MKKEQKAEQPKGFWQRQKEKIVNDLKREAESYKEFAKNLKDAGESVYYQSKIPEQAEPEVDWSNPYEVMSAHAKIVEGQRLGVFLHSL